HVPVRTPGAPLSFFHEHWDELMVLIHQLAENVKADALNRAVFRTTPPESQRRGIVRAQLSQHRFDQSEVRVERLEREQLLEILLLRFHKPMMPYATAR